MTPSPEAGELTPERLAERLAERSLRWVRSLASAKLDRDAAEALQATQAQLEKSDHDYKALWSAHAREVTRAELAEQEASRCKAEAEGAVGQVRAIYKDGWEDGSLAGPTAYMNSRVNSEEAWLNSESFRALSSIRGDAP